MNQNKYKLILLILILVLPSLGSTIELTDDMGNHVKITDDSRIVSVGGDITEIIYALGAEDKLVARDDTSYFPPEVETLQTIGYMRALSAEGILSVNPSLILAAEGAGPPATIKQLRDVGIPLVIIGKDYSHQFVINKIKLISKAVNQVEQGMHLIKNLNQEYQILKEKIQVLPDSPKILSLMNVHRGQLMAAGENTSAEAMIRLAGGQNALSGYDGYKQISIEAAIKAQPDVILLPSHGATQVGGVDAIAAMPEFKDTPAVRNKKIIVMDSLYLLMFGPRYIQAVYELAQFIHPNFDIPEKYTNSKVTY